MKRRNLIQGAIAIPLVGMLPPAWAGQPGKNGAPMAFAFGGSKKMLYDVRQRPQAVHWNGKVYIGYKGGGTEANKSQKRELVAPTHASLVRYDPASRTFSDPITFGDQTSDHHDCPVLWVDKDEYLHFLYKCHNDPGMHRVATAPGGMGNRESDWAALPEIAPLVSYPTLFAIPGDKHLIYDRTGGHSSSWS